MLQCQSYIGVLAPLCLLATFNLFTLTASYKPVIVIHGLMESPLDFQLFLQFISETHPGTNVTVVDLYDRGASTTPLWLQVEDFRRAIHPIMQNAADGVHLICYSQGGLICRALLSTMPDHNVDTFISLSSPQMGQYGDANMTLFFPGYVKSNLYRFCYTFMGQSFSICNYWNDPYHHTLYLKNNEFLPMLNAEKPHPNATAWKKNFLRIRKLVLIGGPNDGIIGPWESSLFGFYDGYGVREMKSQWVYLQDTFGLKTLDARGDIASCVMPGIAHTQWHSNRKVYDTCIAKWLT